jgi:hypothetical protein
MPNLVGPTRGFRHSVDSALGTLSRLGVLDQVILESAGPGPGWAPGTIVRQSPDPGARLTARTVIVLEVAGVGGFHGLPFALRTVSEAKLVGPDPITGATAGQEIRETVGVDRVLASIDDQVLKLSHRIRQAGGYLDLHPDRPATAYRWLREIFHLSPESWPQARWYQLARLLSVLHRVAGRMEGIRQSLESMLQVEVSSIETRKALIPLAPPNVTRLGARATRLGVDAVAGPGVVAEVGLRVTFAVPSAAVHRELQRTAEARQRRALYALLLPAHICPDAVEERWRIGDRGEGAHLDGHGGPAFLGEAAYLGAAPTAGA